MLSRLITALTRPSRCCGVAPSSSGVIMVFTIPLVTPQAQNADGGLQLRAAGEPDEASAGQDQPEPEDPGGRHAPGHRPGQQCAGDRACAEGRDQRAEPAGGHMQVGWHEEHRQGVDRAHSQGGDHYSHGQGDEHGAAAKEPDAGRNTSANPARPTSPVPAAAGTRIDRSARKDTAKDAALMISAHCTPKTINSGTVIGGPMLSPARRPRPASAWPTPSSPLPSPSPWPHRPGWHRSGDTGDPRGAGALLAVQPASSRDAT